jgi:hypothetical protein
MDGAAQVLLTLAEKMKRDVDVGLLADFQRFCREKAANPGVLAPAVKSVLERDHREKHMTTSSPASSRTHTHT